ncbi:MAG: sulfite exporter TauE/SafE family protein [Nitrospirae bacterium]|jgi:uncharacterized membrane protein YfcA|nr:sulfite exporter TauE/SafE family protein [Nitrospirota bacterium]
MVQGAVLVGIYLGLGGVSGFLSGLLGIGGGVVLLPALLFLLPLVVGQGITPFQATEISMIQVTFAALMGILVHRPAAHVPIRRIVLWALSALSGGAIGGFLSYRFSGRLILLLFLAETCLALLLLLFRPSEHPSGAARAGSPLEFPVLSAIGLTSGILGVGGGFLFYPVLTLFFRYPSYVAVGSSLAVMFPMAAAASLFKIVASGSLAPPTIPIVLGALVGSVLGSRFTKRLGSSRIRLFQGILLVLTILRILGELIKWKDLG